MVPSQRRVGQMVAAVADIRNLQSRVRGEFLLNAKVERLTVAQVEGSRVDANRKRQHSRGIGVRVHVGKDTRIIARAAWTIPTEAVRVIGSQLRSKTIRNPSEERHPNGIVDQAKRFAEHSLGAELIRKTQRGAEILRVFVLVEAVAAVLGEHEGAGAGSGGGADGIHVEVRPVAVFLMKAKVVVPAQPHTQSELGCDLIAVLGVQEHALLPAVQVVRHGLAGVIHLTQKKTGIGKSIVRVARPRRGVTGKVKREGTRTGPAVDLVCLEVTAEGEVVASLGPGDAVAGDD